MRRLITALALIASLVGAVTPSFSQVPPPIPGEPDAERRTRVVGLIGLTGPFNVGFDIYGDGTDYDAWIEVWINGVLVPAAGSWTLSSPSGPLSTRPRPITDAQITFIAPQTGYLDIVGARRPRRTSQFTENRPVTARDLNQLSTDIVMTERERWDRFSRTVKAPPGETLATLPSAATRANKVPAFNGAGDLITIDIPGPGVLGGPLNMNNFKIFNLADPSSPQDAATKAYVDTFVSPLKPVADITALKALSTTFTSAELLDANRQGIFVWRLGDYSLPVAADTQNCIYVKADSTASNVGAWVRIYDQETMQSQWCGIPNDGTDQSTALNTALQTLRLPAATPVARTLKVFPGTHFKRTSLVFPQKGYMRFYPEDDTTQNPLTTRGTSEYILLAFNATLGGGGGIVNENRFQATYNPGLIINLLKDSPAQDSFLAAGACRIPTASCTAKASFLLEDEYFTTFLLYFNDYGSNPKSVLDGISLQGYQRRITFTVNSSAGLAGTVGSKVFDFDGVNATSFGYFVSRDATHVTLDWQFGQFTAGHQLYDGAGGPYPVISASVPTATPNQPMYFGNSVAGISFGIPPGPTFTDFSFAGRPTIGPTYGFSQNTAETVVRPAAVWVGDWAAPTVGKQILLDVNNRLVVREGTSLGTANMGYVGGVAAFSYFNDGAGVSANAYNVASVVRTGVGTYVVTFTTPLTKANPIGQVSNKAIQDTSRITAISGTAASITNYDTTTLVANDLRDLAFFTVIGGM